MAGAAVTLIRTFFAVTLSSQSTAPAAGWRFAPERHDDNDDNDDNLVSHFDGRSPFAAPRFAR
jgi:hypothetical protein